MREETELNSNFESTIPKRTGRREKNRARLWVYDAALLLLVWFFVLVLHPSVGYVIPTDSLVVSLVLAFVLFSGTRLFIESNKCSKLYQV